LNRRSGAGGSMHSRRQASWASEWPPRTAIGRARSW
jgi:hypothetical protein